MKKEWPTKPLGEVFETVTGNTPPKSNAVYFGRYVPLVKPPELKDGEVATAEDGLSEEGSRVARVAPPGSVLVSCIGNLGKVGLNSVPVAFNQQINAIIPNRAEAIPEYLFYQVLSCRFRDQLNSLASGTTVSIVNKSRFNSIELVLPPLAEQRRIVGVLDETFASLATAQAHAERNLQNARALFESHLQSVFTQGGKGWVERKVSEVAKHSLGKMLDKAKNKGELHVYLRNVNVRWFEFDLSDLLQMPFLPTEVAKYTAVRGDVLICEGGYPGRAAIWEYDEPIYFQKALHRVRFHEPEHNKWFVYYLYAQDRSGALKKHFNGAGIQHFTGEGLAKFEIPLPLLPELRRAVSKFDALLIETQRLEGLYQQKQTALSALKKSLLHQAFSGAL